MQWRQAVGEVKLVVLLGELDGVIAVISFIEGCCFDVDRLWVLARGVPCRSSDAPSPATKPALLQPYPPSGSVHAQPVQTQLLRRIGTTFGAVKGRLIASSAAIVSA